MTPRPLGSSGVQLPPIGLGTVKLGRTAALRLAAPAVIPTDEDALALLRTAAALGVRLIDTAPAYGTSESRLGQLLPMAGPRDRWFLCTKAGETFDPTSAGSTWDFSPAHVQRSVEGSLERLRVDRLDLALLHFASSSPDAAVLRDGQAIAALRSLQARGLVGLVGASVGSPGGAELAVERCDVVMLTLNSHDLSMAAIAARAAARGVGVLAKRPLASGHADPLSSLRAALRTPGVTAAVIGTTSPEHLARAVAAADA